MAARRDRLRIFRIVKTPSTPARIGVDIIQPIIPAYRVPLFERLSRLPDIDLTVQASAAMPNGQASIRRMSFDNSTESLMKRVLWTRLLWQQGLTQKKVSKPGDVLVLCGDLHYLSNLLMAWRARRAGAGIIWWGHSWSTTTTLLSASIRHRVMRVLPDVVLVYSDVERTRILREGFAPERLFATNNAIDIEPIQQATARLDCGARARILAAAGLTGCRLLLFCSVLNSKTNLDMAIRMLTLGGFSSPEWRLVVVGDGPMRGAYEQLARARGVAERVHWLGAMTDQEKLAPWFLSAEALIYPGNIGLSLLHAFAYGLPVVTHHRAKHHGPEFAAMQDGKTGYLFREGDVLDLARASMRLVMNGPARVRLGQAAHERVLREWSMNQMVERFAQAIRVCSEVSLAQAKRGGACA